jgi:hypothetical protein
MNYFDLVSILKIKTMKTLNFKKTENIFTKFALTSEEMINVRGGNEGEPILLPPSPPPVKI